MVFAATVFILAQRIHIGPPPAHPSTFSLTLNAVDWTGRPMGFVEISLTRTESNGSERLVETREVDRAGHLEFRNLPSGVYALTGQLSGFLTTRVGPIPLNDDTEIPPIKMMFNALTL